MCGRFALAKPKKIKAEDLKVKPAEVEALAPRYNIAPSQSIPAIKNEAERHIKPLKWGLIPSWASDPSIGQRMINARSETLVEKPTFKGLLNKHRCIILADGFYEWAEGPRGKTPFFIHLKSAEPFTFAGLWSHWEDAGRQEILTCTIVTCAANEIMSNIHNRMPVILGTETRDAWLDPGNTNGQSLAELLRPYPSAEMEAYPVSKLVNSPENDVEECTAKRV